MEFINKYNSWIDGISKVTDYLTTKSDSELIKLKDLPPDIRLIYDNIWGYNAYVEFENFILSSSDKKKVIGLITSTEKKLNNYRERWERIFNDETFEKATHEVSLYSTREMKMVIHHFNQHFDSVSWELNRIKSLYTDLEVQPIKSFYKRHYKKYIDQNCKYDLYSKKFTFEDWKKGTIDEEIIDWKIRTGRDIEEFILPAKIKSLSNELMMNDHLFEEEQREFLKSMVLSRNFLNYRILLIEINGLVSEKDWIKILECQKTMYSILLENELKYLKNSFSSLIETTIDKLLLVTDILTEINEILDGNRKTFTFPILHDFDEIRKSYFDIKRGYRETMNIRYDENCFNDKYKKHPDLLAVYANSHCVAEALFLFQKDLQLIKKDLDKQVIEIPIASEVPIKTAPIIDGFVLSRLSNYLKSNKYKITLSVGEIQLLKKPIGQGGNGIVYEGKINNKIIAIKFLVTDAKGNSKKQKLKRFLAEYFNIVTIQNTSNIVRYIDYDILNLSDKEGKVEIPTIIMKRYESSLAKYKKANNEEEFLRLFSFLISILEKIHSEGIIHRDIKPENIFIEGNEFALADFGIASYNPDIFKIMASTDKKERIGNRLFSAPEQEDGGIEAHITMDIYSMGQILQWYATGNTHRGTGRKKITTVFKDLQIYDQIIDKCLEHNPNKRFQTALEIKEYLKQNSEKDIFEYLYLFNEICRSNYPRNDLYIVHSNDLDKIDRILEAFKKNETEFKKELWWTDGNGNYDFTLNQKGNGIWKFSQNEYSIKEIWIHYDSSVFNDFILIHYQKGEPFEFEGTERYFTAIVNDQHHISFSEYQNGFAEIGGKILDLSEHKIEIIEREDKEGYFFIGTRFHCILQPDNDERIREFISVLLTENRSPTINELQKFQKEIRKNKDMEVRIRL